MKLHKRSPIKLGVTHQRILTLYDLIEAVQEEVCPEEEGLVTDVVIGSLKSGRVKFLNPKLKHTHANA
jgi:hypothetical protein